MRAIRILLNIGVVLLLSFSLPEVCHSRKHTPRFGTALLLAGALVLDAVLCLYLDFCHLIKTLYVSQLGTSIITPTARAKKIE